MKDFQLSFSTLSDCKDKLSKLFIDNPQGKYRITLTKWTKKRSISMNAQQHLFYTQIANAQGDKSALDVKNMCKLMFGLPIILNSESHSDKMEFLLNKLEFYQHSYESKIKLIQCLSITSLFNTAESKQYCEHMITYYNDLSVPVPIKFKE